MFTNKKKDYLLTLGIRLLTLLKWGQKVFSKKRATIYVFIGVCLLYAGSEFLVMVGKELQNLGFAPSIIGSIYLDSAFPLLSCRDLVEKHFSAYIPDIPNNTIFNDYKSALQEYLQKNGREFYYDYVESGPDHNKEFTCTTRLNNGDPLCQGFGHSKKTASQEAAKKTLAFLQSN